MSSMSALDVLILAWIARTWWKGYAAIREAEVTADAQIYTAQVNLLVKRQELRARGIQVADVEPQPGFFRRRGGSVEEVRNPFAEAFERVRRGMIVALGGVVDEEW